MLLFQICDTTVLTAHPCFQLMLSNDHAAPGLFLTMQHGCLHWGSARNWEGAQPGQLISEDWGLSHNIWHHAPQQKLGEEERKDIWSYGICLPKYLLWVMDPFFPGDSKTPVGSGEWIPNSALLMCPGNWTIFIITHLFLHFCCFDFLPIPPGWEGQGCGEESNKLCGV